MSQTERPEQYLPEGYSIDESGVDVVVLYYLTSEVVGNYTKYVTKETLISDAEAHQRQKEA